MIRNNNWKLAAMLSIAGALALSAAPADARVVYRHDHVFESPLNYDASPANGPSAHFVDDGVGYNGTGTFSDGREVPGTNWNPNGR